MARHAGACRSLAQHRGAGAQNHFRGQGRRVQEQIFLHQQSKQPPPVT